MLRLCVPTWQMRLVRPATAVMIAPSRTLCVAGFSTYTSLPFSMAHTAIRACQWLGVAMETMSTSLLSTTLRMSFSYFGAVPCLPSMDFIALPMTASSQSQTVVISQLFLPRKPPTWDMPRPRTPTTATRSLSLAPRADNRLGVGAGFGHGGKRGGGGRNERGTFQEFATSEEIHGSTPGRPGEWEHQVGLT